MATHTSTAGLSNGVLGQYTYDDVTRVLLSLRASVQSPQVTASATITNPDSTVLANGVVVVQGVPCVVTPTGAVVVQQGASFPVVPRGTVVVQTAYLPLGSFVSTMSVVLT